MVLHSKKHDDGTSLDGGSGMREHDADQAELAGLPVQGIILAGVHSWGHGALERVTCRPLLPIASRPLLTRVAEWLGEAGVKEACVCGNSDTPQLRRCLRGGEAVGLKLRYYEDEMPRGPAGCVHDAAMLCREELLVVVEGTIVPRVDLSAVLRAHRQGDAALTMVVASEPSGGSKSPTSLRATNAGEPLGIYIISAAALSHVPARGYQDLKEVLIPRLYKAGERVQAYGVSPDLAPRVTGAASYLAVSSWAVRRMSIETAWQVGYRQAGESWIHHSAQVSEQARLMGPVLVGPDSVVEHGAILIGPTIIGSSCRVEQEVVISRTVVWDRCRLGRGAIVDHSILTDDTEIAERLVVRNTLWAANGPASRRLMGNGRPVRPVEAQESRPSPSSQRSSGASSFNEIGLTDAPQRLAHQGPTGGDAGQCPQGTDGNGRTG